MERKRNVLTGVLFTVFAGIVCGIPCAYGASSTLMFTNLSNKSYTLTGPGINVSGNTSQNVTFVATGAGVCNLVLNPVEGVSSYVRFDITAGGIMSNVVWKDADSSLSGGGFVSMNTACYALQNGGSTLKLNGIAITVDFSKIDIAAMTIGQLSTGNQPSATQLVFPGDYTFSGPNYAGTVYFEVAMNGDISTDLKWNYSALNGSNKDVLHSSFYTVDQANKDLTFEQVFFTYDLTLMPAGELILAGIKLGTNLINAGGSGSAGLLPGRYVSSYYSFTGITYTHIGDFRVDVENGSGNFANLLYWKAAGTQTFNLFDNANYYREPLEIHILEVPGVNPSSHHESAAAMLKRSPDGGAYEVAETLLVQYQEEYHDGTLVWKIYDMERNDVTPAGITLATAYGNNRFPIDVSSLADDDYMLEVKNEKGEVFFVRFRKK